MQLESDTVLLDFLITEGGRLSANQGYGYLYWYGQRTARTEIVEGRTAREAISAAIAGEDGYYPSGSVPR